MTEFKKKEKRFQINRLRLSLPGLENIFISIQDCFFLGSGIGGMVMYSDDQHFSQSFQIFFWEILCKFHSMYINSKWLHTKYSSLTEVNLCKYFTENIIWCIKHISLVNMNIIINRALCIYFGQVMRWERKVLIFPYCYLLLLPWFVPDWV